MRKAQAHVWRKAASATCLLAVLLLTSGCSDFLEVENPNNVKGEDLKNPAAATPIANGSLALTATALDQMVLDQAAATDELKWVGSRDGYVELERGHVTNPANEFSDATWFTVGRARWMAEEGIRNLEEFNKAGTLLDKSDLARVYLYGAIMYVAIADHYDDYVISDRGEPGTPVGAANMATFYDQAVKWLDTALPIAQATGKADLERAIIAMRARAKFDRAIWQKLNPGGSVPAQPLVNDAAADADINLFLSKTSTDWKLTFKYAASQAFSSLGAWVNSRLEFRLGDPYITPTSNNKDVAAPKLRDIIDNVVSPPLAAAVTAFDVAQTYPQLTWLSTREVRLQAAEIALARGNNELAATHFNAVRAFDRLTPWDPSNPAHPTGIAMLKHMRMANLFLQGKRLMDHYRFGDPDADWTSDSAARTKPGSFFPITRVELESNCKINGSC